MNTLRRSLPALAMLFLASASGSALADSFTGKITQYQIYSNTSSDNYSVKIGPYTLTAARANAELLREAFFRKLTVIVGFTPTSCFFTPPCGHISSVTILSADLP